MHYNRLDEAPMKRITLLSFGLLLLLFSTSATCANSGSFKQSDIESDSRHVSEVNSDTWRSFETLFDVISQSKKDLDILRKKVVKARDDVEREKIENEIALVQSNIESLQAAWEMWATGGVDMELFLPRKEEKFDWREEIQAVFEPVVVELQRLTERPRKIERLQTEQAFFQQQLDAASAALKNIDEYKKKAPSGTLKGAFKELETSWRKRHDGIQSRLTVIELQLKDLSSPDQVIDKRTGETLKNILSGSLLNLVLAIIAAAFSFAVMRLINKLYIRLITRSGRQRPLVARIAHLSFILLSIILAILAAVTVLYLRGDRILLALLLIALIGAALTLQRTLPAFMKEARILLNIGPVREGQRLIYNGIPWKVQSINMYSALVNPELSGGKMMLPLKALADLQSRPYDDSEPWFPTKKNDYVLLDDQTYGRVELQTPEQVTLRVRGSDKTYSVESFLGSNPQNLSLHGFAIIIHFGIDYQHQALVTSEIQKQLGEYLASHLRETRWGEYLQDFFVEFEEAAASSLNFVIYASFSGEAADSYYPIQRTLQSLAVDACNTYGWVIPFTQMTVHLEKND